MLKQNGPVSITHTSGQAVAENNASKGISLPAVSPLQKMNADPKDLLPEPAPIQMKAHVPPKFILQKTTPVENNVPPPFQLKSGVPVVQRAINILPGPHLQGAETAQRWNAQQAYAQLPAEYRANGVDQQLLLNVLTAMDTQNWFGASYLGFCQEVANRYVAEQQLQQQQQPQMDDQQVDAEVEMEGQQQEQEPGQHQQEEGNNLHAQDFYDEDELIDEEGGEAVQAPPARTYPTGIDRSMAVVEFNPREGNYGSSFVTGFTSSSGDEEATDLEGIQVREVVTVGRNDLEAPDAIETAETVIDSNGMLNDQIGTNAARIHRSVPGLTNFPAIYETPQTLYWKYSNEDNGAWRLLANIAITVTVRDDSREGDRYRDLTVVTTYNGESVEQKYIGPRVRR